MKKEFDVLLKKTNDRLRALEQFHRLEIQRLKDAHQAAEKLRQEKWLAEKTRKLHDFKFQSIAPEIQNLISRHKAEISKMTTVHQAEIANVEQRATQHYLQMIDELREQLDREKNDAVSREREIAREKYEKATRDDQQNLIEQRLKLLSDIDEERTRNNDLVNKQKAEFERFVENVFVIDHFEICQSAKSEIQILKFLHATETCRSYRRITTGLSVFLQIMRSVTCPIQSGFCVDFQQE